MSICPLSASDIVTVLNLYDVYDKPLYFELIIEIDKAWLEWAYKNQGKPKGQ